MQAEDPQAAEQAAINNLRSDAKLRAAVVNDRMDPPEIYVDEVGEVSEGDVPKVTQGFTFFPQEE